MFIIHREYWFSAAHRLEGHPKCGRLHGHNYKVVVYLSSVDLDHQGMVLDFGQLDRVVKPIVDELDHMYLISESNRANDCPYALIARNQGHARDLNVEHTTAECLSQYLCEEIQGFLDNIDATANQFKVQVWIWETKKSAATHTS